MTEPSQPVLPYPHAHHDCDGCRERDAAMTATYPGLVSRPPRWCTQCAGTALAMIVVDGRTVTVRGVDSLDAPAEWRPPGEADR